MRGKNRQLRSRTVIQRYINITAENKLTLAGQVLKYPPPTEIDPSPEIKTHKKKRQLHPRDGDAALH